MTVKASKAMFQDFPDVLSVPQVAGALGVSTKTVYHMLSDGRLAHVKVGRNFKIAKLNLINFVLQDPQKIPWTLEKHYGSVVVDQRERRTKAN